MKPILKYRGGKSKEIPNIIQHVPRFEGRYIEPFFGGGALYFYLKPQKAIINDINEKLIGFYNGVRNNYTQLRKELDQIENLYKKYRQEFDELKTNNPESRVHDKNEDLYYELRNMFNGNIKPSFSEALLYFYINKTAYSGMIRYNSKGEFNVPFGRYKNLNTSGVTAEYSELLQNAEIFNLDYEQVFNMCAPEDFVFLDPPYDCVFSDYGNDEYRDGFGENEHIRLANNFAQLPCKAMMVIARTPLIEELYQGYIVDEYAKSYAVNIRNRFKSAATHLIITNYNEHWEAPANYNIIQEVNNRRLEAYQRITL